MSPSFAKRAFILSEDFSDDELLRVGYLDWLVDRADFARKVDEVATRLRRAASRPARRSRTDSSTSSINGRGAKPPSALKTSRRTNIAWSPVAIPVRRERQFMQKATMPSPRERPTMRTSNRPQGWLASASATRRSTRFTRSRSPASCIGDRIDLSEEDRGHGRIHMDADEDVERKRDPETESDVERWARFGNRVAEHGGNVPLETDDGHFQEGTMSTVPGTATAQEAAFQAYARKANGADARPWRFAVLALIDRLGIDLTPAIAKCLLYGIVGDTLGFRTPHTTPHAMECAIGRIGFDALLDVVGIEAGQLRASAREFSSLLLQTD